MNTTNLRRLLETINKRLAPDDSLPGPIWEVLDAVPELLAENERLRAELIFIRDKEQAALNEAESLRFNIPEDAGCMEILHAARKALEQKS
jgi:hypothetical protein